MRLAEIVQSEELPFNQEEDGGAIPTSPLQFRVFPCDFSDITSIFNKFHYKKSHMGGGISLCLKLDYGGRIIGGAVIGKPRHQNRYKRCLEIRRMACLDDAPKNTESYFLSKIIWFLKRYDKSADAVISYSDMSVGHKGTIYKAANFKCVGETSPSVHVYWNGKRYHPRSLSIERPYSYKLRTAINSGDAIKTVELPKKIWIYQLQIMKGHPTHDVEK